MKTLILILFPLVSFSQDSTIFTNDSIPQTYAVFVENAPDTLIQPEAGEIIMNYQTGCVEFNDSILFCDKRFVELYYFVFKKANIF